MGRKAQEKGQKNGSENGPAGGPAGLPDQAPARPAHRPAQPGHRPGEARKRAAGQAGRLERRGGRPTGRQAGKAGEEAGRSGAGPSARERPGLVGWQQPGQEPSGPAQDPVAGRFKGRWQAASSKAQDGNEAGPPGPKPGRPAAAGCWAGPRPEGF